MRLQSPYTGVSTPPNHEIPQKSQKALPGPPGPECQKSVEKVPKDPKRSQKGIKISVRGLVRHFCDTPGQEAREDLIETFWGFRGSGVWRLLYMGIVIVSLDSSCFQARRSLASSSQAGVDLSVFRSEWFGELKTQHSEV